MAIRSAHRRRFEIRNSKLSWFRCSASEPIPLGALRHSWFRYTFRSCLPPMGGFRSLPSLGQALRGNDVKAGGMNRRRAPIGGRPHAERRDEDRIAERRDEDRIAERRDEREGIGEIRNSKFEIRNYPGSDALRRNLCHLLLFRYSCFEIRIFRYSCFDIRIFRYSCFDIRIFLPYPGSDALRIVFYPGSDALRRNRRLGCVPPQSGGRMASPRRAQGRELIRF